MPAALGPETRRGSAWQPEPNSGAADGAPGWTTAERGAKRGALRRLLNATVNGRAPGDVSYYQGLHDVAAVLLFVAGERTAAPMLARLAVCHLRDCTRCAGRCCCCLACCMHARPTGDGTPLPM